MLPYILHAHIYVRNPRSNGMYYVGTYIHTYIHKLGLTTLPKNLGELLFVNTLINDIVRLLLLASLCVLYVCMYVACAAACRPPYDDPCSPRIRMAMAMPVQCWYVVM